MTNEVRGRSSSRLPGVGAQGRGMVRGYPKFFEELYREYGNPIWAWKALLAVHKAGLPMPDWLTEYLVQSAENVVNAQTKRGIPQALGFSSKRHDYKSSRIQDDRLHAKQMFEQLHRMYPDWSDYKRHKTIAAEFGWPIDRVKNEVKKIGLEPR